MKVEEPGDPAELPISGRVCAYVCAQGAGGKMLVHLETS